MIRVLITELAEDGSTVTLGTAVFRNDERAAGDQPLQTYDFEVKSYNQGFKGVTGRVAHDKTTSAWGLVSTALETAEGALG